MKITFSSHDRISRIVAALAAVCESEVCFEVNYDGLTCTTMDSRHISMMRLTLALSEFKTYEWTQNMKFNVNLYTLRRIMSCGDAQDTVTMECLDGLSFATDVKVSFRGPNHTVDYMILNSSEAFEEIVVPPTTYSTMFVVPSVAFRRMIDNLTTNGDNGEPVTIEMNSNGKIFVETKYGKHIEILEVLHPSVVHRRAEAGLKRSFSLIHLRMFVEATRLEDEVAVYMNSDVPMKMRCGPISYYVLPTLEDE